jgi:hypothetical protein
MEQKYLIRSVWYYYTNAKLTKQNAGDVRESTAEGQTARCHSARLPAALLTDSALPACYRHQAPTAASRGPLSPDKLQGCMCMLDLMFSQRYVGRDAVHSGGSSPNAACVSKMVVFDKILNVLYSGSSNSIVNNLFSNVAVEKGTDRPRPLSPTPFAIHYSLIVPPFDAI